MSRTAPSPALWTWCVLLLASLGVIGAIVWTVWPGIPSVPELSSRRVAAPLPGSPAAGEHRRVRLFFPQESGEVLKEQERELEFRGTLTEDVRAVLNALAAAGGPGVQPPLPQGLEIRQVFLDGVGILYLDLGKGIRAVLGVPGSGSTLALSAIVTTLTTSFTEIKRVQFLSEGQELTEPVGGIDLRRPVAPRFPGEEGPPVTSRSQVTE